MSDEKGRYLLVNPTGSKLWRWKYRVDGKEKLMALGNYPDVSLAQAREKREQVRKLLATDVDPMAQKKADNIAHKLSHEHSFSTVARTWWLHWMPARSEYHAAAVMRRVENDVFPAIGSRPISEIKAPELVAMVKLIASRGVLLISRKDRFNTGQIFRYAIAHGKAERNPATDIRPSDILEARKKKNLARIDGKELPDLLRRIERYQGAAVTRLAMKLMAFTFVRTSELIEAEWKEIDLEVAEWRILAERMKMNTPHFVPLSAQAVEILRTLQLISGHSKLLFPGERNHDKAMSNNTILGALKRMGYQGRMTGHGFRGVASTLLHEMGFDHAHIELQLAHQERNEVSAAYNYATYLAPRRTMMQAWADYLDSRKGGAVIARKLGKQAA